MTEEDTDIMDEILQMRLMYAIRDNMQRYYRGEKIRQMPEGQSSQFTADNVMSAYFALLKKTKSEEEAEGIEKQIVDHVYDEVKKIEFGIDYPSFHTTDRAADLMPEKNIEENPKNNKFVKKINDKIRQELEYRRKTDKSSGPQDAEPISISVAKSEKGYDIFRIEFAESDIPLDIMIYHNNKGTKYGTYAALNNKDDKKGLSLNQEDYSELIKKGNISLKGQKIQNAGKKYTKSEYKNISGLTDDSLIAKEVEFINGLTKTDQERFIKEAVKQRKDFNEKKNNYLKQVETYEDKLKSIDISEDPKKVDEYGALIKKLFFIPAMAAKTEAEMGGTGKGLNQELRDSFVTGDMVSKDEFWEYFYKGTNNYTTQSKFENQMQHIIDREISISGEKIKFSSMIDDILSTSDAKLADKIKEGFSKIQSAGDPPLPQNLTAEIFTYGVFLRAMRSPSDEKFEKMNKILNDFGINIAFNELKVVKIPGVEITKAREQYEKDRAEFEATKRYAIHEEREKEFKKYAKENGVEKIKDPSVHHFIPLKYNAFVEDKLNQNSNYIFTARQNLWNVDIHQLVHRFDTDGNFLLKYGDNNMEYRDFNGTRNLYRTKKNENVCIMAPVLQVKKDGRFVNVLHTPDKKNNGFFISTDKTESIFIVPSYCKGGGGPHSNGNNNTGNGGRS